MLEKLKILFPRLPQKKLEEVLAEGDSKYCIYSIVFLHKDDSVLTRPLCMVHTTLFVWCTTWLAPRNISALHHLV